MEEIPVDATAKFIRRTGLWDEDAAILVTCPAHQLLVAIDEDGRLLGRCQGCATEAARAIRIIEEAT